MGFPPLRVNPKCRCEIERPATVASAKRGNRACNRFKRSAFSNETCGHPISHYFAVLEGRRSDRPTQKNQNTHSLGNARRNRENANECYGTKNCSQAKEPLETATRTPAAAMGLRLHNGLQTHSAACPNINAIGFSLDRLHVTRLALTGSNSQFILQLWVVADFPKISPNLLFEIALSRIVIDPRR